jgi:hypothetical protein
VELRFEFGKAGDVGDVVETGCDGLCGSWFCVGGQTGGRVNG